MAQWGYSFDTNSPAIKVGDIQYDVGQNPRFEYPNNAAYVTFVHPDGRLFTPDAKFAKRRVPYETHAALIAKLAEWCGSYDDFDNNRATLLASELLAFDVTRGQTIVPVQPDLSKLKTLQAAQLLFQEKVGLALKQKQIADAVAVDPTIVDAQAALEDAQAAIAVAATENAQAIGL